MPARPTFVLISFVSSHSFNRPFTCEICGKTWVKLGKLRDHLKTHSTEKNELCDLCGRAFKTRAELKDHKSDAHTEGNTCYVFSCHGNEVSEVSFLRWRDILSGPNLNMVAWCLSLNMVMQIWWMHRRYLACFIFYGYGVYRLFFIYRSNQFIQILSIFRRWHFWILVSLVTKHEIHLNLMEHTCSNAHLDGNASFYGYQVPEYLWFFWSRALCLHFHAGLQWG